MNKRKKEITPQLNSTLESGYTKIWCACYTGLVFKHVEKVHCTLSNKINFPLPHNLCPIPNIPSLCFFFNRIPFLTLGRKAKGWVLLKRRERERQSVQNLNQISPELTKHQKSPTGAYKTDKSLSEWFENQVRLQSSSFLFFLDFSSLICCMVASPVLPGKLPRTKSVLICTGFSLKRYVPASTEQYSHFTPFLMRLSPNWWLWIRFNFEKRS